MAIPVAITVAGMAIGAAVQGAGMIAGGAGAKRDREEAIRQFDQQYALDRERFKADERQRVWERQWGNVANDLDARRGAHETMMNDEEAQTNRLYQAGQRMNINREMRAMQNMTIGALQSAQQNMGPVDQFGQTIPMNQGV